MPALLPVDSLRDAFLDLRSRNVPVIVTSPTGSGKSTRVPVWCAEGGRTLVVEPRRVVARALARRVASETRTRLGDHVGYAVRDDARWGDDTRILFATPGVALRMLSSGTLDDFDTWVLDEFHERRAETDLLLALARHRGEEHRLVLLSATLDAQPIAREIGAEVLHAEGRMFPVTIEHLPIPLRVNPDPSGLPLRLERALAGLEVAEGVVLVFLPGVGEIHEAHAWLEGRVDAEILRLHGQMDAEEQDRALSDPPPGRPRVVLATNVAESALTVPGVVAVIDSGLERKLVRENGLPALVLAPVSRSSADQRTGRAGRVRPGRCIRLWASSARLAPRSSAAIQVDEPDDWLLPLLASGISPETLPWIDRPLANGLRDARDRLSDAGLWDADPWDPALPARGRLTRRGAEATELPLSPSLAGFVLALRDTPAAWDAVRLAAALAGGRPILRARPTPEQTSFRRELAGPGGDPALLARLVDLEEEEARRAGISVSAWREASASFARLARALELEPDGWPGTFQTESVQRAWARVFPRSLRTRRGQAGREEYALGGGSSWLLSRDSLAWTTTAPELVLVFARHAGEDRSGKVRTWIDAASALTRPQALAIEAGRAEVLSVRLENGFPSCRLRRRVGDLALGETTHLPSDPRSLGQILSRVRPDAASVERAVEEHWRSLCAAAGRWIAPPGPASDWLERAEARRVAECGGLEARLADASPEPPPPPDEAVAGRLPGTLAFPGGEFQVRYDALKGRISLTATSGKAPSLKAIARPACWEGWTVVLVGS